MGQVTYIDNKFNNTCLTRWIRQVKKTLNKGAKQDEWQLIGTCVIIEHTTERHGQEIAKGIAQSLELPLFEIEGKSVSSSLDIEGPAVCFVSRNVWGQSGNEQIIDINDESNERVQAVNKILGLIDVARPLLILLMTGDFTHVPESLRCLGKFDRRFDCRFHTNQQIGKNFIEWLGWNICDDSIKSQIEQVGRLLRSEVSDERRQGLMIAALRRRWDDTQKLLTLVDVLHFALHGTSEFDTENSSDKRFNRCSVHEAGHAVVAMLDSDGEDIPDYGSIGTSHDFAGITTRSFSYRINEDFDQGRVLHQVRTSLGGRAAEQIVFGAHGTGTYSSSSDLLSITNLLIEMYLSCGFFSDLDDTNTSSDHLIVAMDEPMPHQLRRAELAARKLIAKQYQLVVKMLDDHRKLLDIVTQEFNTKQLLISDDFRRVWIDYSSKEVNIAA